MTRRWAVLEVRDQDAWAEAEAEEQEGRATLAEARQRIENRA